MNMIADSMARQGSWFFRWRSYVLLGFAPLVLLVVTEPEPIETVFGPTADTLFETACIALAFLGLAIRAYVVGYVPAGTSGRNTARQVADTLNTTGLYSLTRNPLYLGNAVIYMAIACFLQNVWFAVLMLLFLIVYLERIIATEEKFLAGKFGDAYRNWAAEVPAFFPRLDGWQAPDLPFSLRNVLRREYSGLFAIIAVFFVLDQSREYLAESKTAVDPNWLAALAIGALAYVLLRWAKKRTRLLNVAGR
jgi:protein-S-isoprenylcysteine O-methyltransferase Ste14